MRLFFLLLVLAIPAAAQDRASVERQFQTWLAQDIWPDAKARGITRDMFERATQRVRLNWDLPDLVPPGADPDAPRAFRQSEFGAPARYFAPNSVQGAARVGREMAARHATALASAEAAYGVPRHILLAIWGRESAYGRATIPHDALEILATKGFMARRAAMFRQEFLAALEIFQRGDAKGPLRSSWAGALGQPQFMPSNYLTYARDGDGDGRADIWGSEADTLHSIAHYLARHGWQPGRDWGFEIRLPESVSCTLEGPDQGRPLEEWEALGIARISGRPFPRAERVGQMFLMLPSGRKGPAFLITPNFYVLKDYNTSDLYALFVGHVGDRIAYRVGDFAADWQRTDSMLRSDIAAAQRTLIGMGHDVGGADGLPGFKTRRSIGRWQEANGSPSDCWPNQNILRNLR